jgi:polyisoprenoid-binding protein YceI
MIGKAFGTVAAAALASGLVLPSASAHAAPQELRFEPGATTIRFTLGATLHTAEGSLKLERGALRFDPDTGSAEGEVVIDATSADTGFAKRDENMHRDVLESARYPRIVFRAEGLEVLRRDAESAEIRLLGQLEMHGTSRPFAIPAKLEARGDRIGIASSFRVDYVDWGIVDYSTFLLRVDRFVDVTVEAEGRLAAP